MNLFENLSGHPVIEGLGWALVHFLWQGALIAFLLANIMSLIPRRAAEARRNRGRRNPAAPPLGQRRRRRANGSTPSAAARSSS